MVEIVAEISGNHGGDKTKAIRLIQYAAKAGCDYAKFQLYRPEDMPDRHEGNNEEMYHKLMVPDEWLPDLFYAAKRASIGLFASVFSVRAVHELLKYDVPYIKTASPESTRLPMETYEAIVAAVPPEVGLIVSCGPRDWGAFDTIPGLRMYCPPGHPPKILASDFGYFTWAHSPGFSDHTPGISVPLAFIRAGAKMIEKHLKIDDDCVDAAFSADPQTMRLLCKLAKNA
jgi:sialic acid synthase SpsE